MTDLIQRRWKWCPTAAVLAIAALPMLLIVVRVIEVGINLPFFDQWFPGSSVDVALAAHNRTLRLSSLWQPNFEHRIVFTHLTTALLARFGQWNVKTEMFISVALAGIALFVILVQLQTLSARRLPVWLGALLSALMFGLRQQNNWLWSFETCWYFALVFVIVTLALLSAPELSAGRLAIAAVTAEAASLSLGSGLLAWPIGFLLLLTRVPRKLGPLFGWAAAAGLAVVVQFHGQSTQLLTRSEPLLPWVLGRGEFVLAFLGAPLLPERHALLGAATAIGGLTLLTISAVLLALRRAGLSARCLSFVLGLAAYAGGSGALVALSNRGTPATNALFGRYTTNATLMPVALVALAWLLLETGRLRRPGRLLAITAPVITAALFVTTSVLSWRPPTFLALPEHLACVDEYVREGRSDCFDGLYPIQFTRTVRLPEFAEAGLAAFAGKPLQQPRHAPNDSAPAEDRAGLDLGLGDSHWRASRDLVPDETGRDAWTAGTDPYWVRLGAIHRCLHDFDSLRVDLTVSGPVKQPLLQVYYTRATEDFDEGHALVVPILPDGARHLYELPLGALNLPNDVCEFRLRVDPLAGGDGKLTRLRVHAASLSRARVSDR